ncbi:MAG: hypothetical protein ACI8UO_001814 [Verrucomicrobiales bacterium]|jgi:hypothetical protein
MDSSRIGLTSLKPSVIYRMKRRLFITSAAAGLAATPLVHSEEPKRRKRLAIITTEWRHPTHAWHMGTRFLVGYPIDGAWHHPEIDVVSAYVDQFPKEDLSRKRAEEFGFPIYPSIAEALRCGGDELAVDAVLIIGEHGNYPKSEFNQTQYPRYEFFKETVKVFEQDGRTAPVFNDKHLSWKWDYAKEMVETARKMNFPFLAGSSLPVTYRLPSVEVPDGSEIEEAMSVALGGVDSYDFHALETIQCMVERRKGGETGVKWLEALRGDAAWAAMEKGSFAAGGWNPDLFHACLSRSHTLRQKDQFSHRFPTPEMIRQMVKDPIAYRFEYRDGLRATMLLMNGLVGDFTFAAKLKGEAKPLSTLFHLPPVPNVVYSAALMSKAEETFMTGKAPYPVERTLLTGGLVEAGCQSLVKGERLETPHLKVEYTAPAASQFRGA